MKCRFRALCFLVSFVYWHFLSLSLIPYFSCLANGNADEFDRGEYLYQANAVHEVFQIGLLNVEFRRFPVIKFYSFMNFFFLISNSVNEGQSNCRSIPHG